jgi:hypothetical protein
MLLLAALDGLGLLGGHEDAPDEVGHALDLDLAEQRVLDAGFLVGGDAEDEPVHALLADGVGVLEDVDLLVGAPVHRVGGDLHGLGGGAGSVAGAAASAWGSVSAVCCSSVVMVGSCASRAGVVGRGGRLRSR